METLILILACVALCAVILGRLATSRTKGHRRTSHASIARKADPLLAACFGDAAKAQRLADYERKRHPYLSSDQARQAAYDRLMHDRQR